MAVAIKITQEIKDKNARYNLNFVKNNAVNTIVRTGYPNKFYVTEPVSGGYSERTDLHTADGWRDIVIPSYNSETQYLGNTVIEVGNEFTYEVFDKTDEQIQQELISQSEIRKEEIIQAQIVLNAEIEAQASDDTNSLNNQALFPMWLYPFEYTLGYKCQSFNANNELKLYKCVQAHTSQQNWQPKDVPALFAEVAYPGQIPVWVQPTGAQDAYNTGDKVYYPTANDDVYESLIDANVFSPDAYPAGWQLIQ